MKMRKSEIFISAFLFLFWVSGNIGIIRLITYFIPQHLHFLSAFLCVLIPCASGVCFMKLDEPLNKKQDELKQARYEIQKLQNQVSAYQQELKRREADAEHMLPILRAYRLASPEERAAFLSISDRQKSGN